MNQSIQQSLLHRPHDNIGMMEYYNYCHGGKGHNANHHLQQEADQEYHTASSVVGHPVSASLAAAVDQFNPRAAAASIPNAAAAPAAAARGGYGWPAPAAAPANFPTEPSTLDQYSSLSADAPPTWWVPPAVTAHAPASPTAASYNIGANYPARPLELIPTSSAAERPVSCASNATMTSVLHVDHDAPTQVDCIPADFPNGVRNNPYLTSEIHNRSASAASRRQQQLHDWSCAEAGLPSRAHLKLSAPTAGTNDVERAVFHPIFSDQQPHASAYPAASANHGLQQFPVLNRPRASPVRSSYTMSTPGDGISSLRALEDELQSASWGADQGRLSVGKSQSMRALYEENAALRRALLSLRRGSGTICMDSTSLPLQTRELPGQDRCITSDVAEGRALSMRERGRWAMQQAAAAAAGVNCPMWAGTPRRQWPAGPPLHGMQAGAGSHHSRSRPCHQNDSWWDHHQEGTTEHPLFMSYGGGSFGGWPELEPMCSWPDDLQNECSPTGNADLDEDQLLAGNGRGGTSLKQLLGRGAGNCSSTTGMDNIQDIQGSQKWSRRPVEGKKKKAAAAAARMRSSCTTEEGYTVDGHQRGPGPVQGHQVGGQCAMCGGRLRQVEAEGGGAKSNRRAGAAAGGLPLRLCPACHPRAAASLPPSTKSPPALPSHRHQLATAVLLACRPNLTTSLDPPKSDADDHSSTPKPVKAARSSRILHLCRHFVGLSTAKASSSSNNR